MNVAVINDIHANYQALKKIDAMLASMTIDKVVVLGDLLSYGVDVQLTLDLLVQMKQQYDCVFIKGNHDQIYFDFQAGRNHQYKPFPKFLEESVQHTAKQLSEPLIDQFDWLDSLTIRDVFFSHANALGYKNWSYLNYPDQFGKNLPALKALGYRVGVFGHTHRAKYISGVDLDGIADLAVKPLLEELTIGPNTTFLMTNGSAGQPRGTQSSFMVIELGQDNYKFHQMAVDYDVALHCQQINHSDLSISTKQRLLGYYE